MEKKLSVRYLILGKYIHCYVSLPLSYHSQNFNNNPLTSNPKMEAAAAATIVLYPAPGIGHIVCMVELAKHVVHHHHYSITILLTTGLLDNPSTDAYIHRISTSHPSISFLRFPKTPLTTATQSRAATAFQFIKTNTFNVQSTLTKISQSSTIKALIIDLFCTSAMEAASSIGIPVYYFFTSGAADLALYSYFPQIHRQTTASFRDMAGVELRAPGNAPVKARQMPEPLLDREDPAYSEMLYFCEHLPKANGIIVNTFPELEPAAVTAVEEGVCFPDPEQAPPVYYIGPLIAEPQQSDDGSKSKDCLSWLDKQPSRSVVFLCFGSRGSFSVAQLKEIAEGLERSGQRFLWVVKRPPHNEGSKQIHDTTGEFNLSSVLPSGFIERTKERGLVLMSWAPQVEVLTHESVGGFVTHCGWNSGLEAVVAGVPMIAWPLYAEQHVNRNVMVEDMKVAVGVEQREEDGFVSGEELEMRVKELMESERGREIKERSLKIRDMALAALGEFGSSTNALANLVQTWN
ncbi:UDP-glycosyltransferase 88F5-like isoform X2 [Lotus japonicus]|uniref:UDP-glycosyltransferase 88F5-like isoform X2 n=1 Tax=Lotus japonicus TaxID=34305 RepID=UPI00258BE1C6|nr:UDP-glycosyltransferase 88F5-like isoform X2 [Lotus japonicus]